MRSPRGRTRPRTSLLRTAGIGAGLVPLLLGCAGENAATDCPPAAAAATGGPGASAPPPGTEVAGTRPTGDLEFLGPVRQLRTGASTVGYRQLGAGPPVVLVPGQGSTMAMWGTSLPRRLADHHRVTMYDLRGVGYSDDGGAVPLTITQMADDLAELITALHLDHPTVVGWSTGGEIALTLAVSHPDAAGALVLTGATAGGPSAVPPDAAAEAAYESGELADLLDLSFTPSGAAARDTYVREVLAAAGTAPGDRFPIDDRTAQRQGDAERRFAADAATADGLDRIHVPTLVANGAEDRLVPPANAELIARRIPGAHRAAYDDAAHLMWFQQLDRFVGDVDATAAATPTTTTTPACRR